MAVGQGGQNSVFAPLLFAIHPRERSCASTFHLIGGHTRSWETPVLDAIIKETTRVAQLQTAKRRNVRPGF
jgi:hypothetical protein